jgi:circadian clock protein KaiC
VAIVDTKTVKTGIEGLDEIVGGGLPRNHLYLVQGDPGNGKTTFGIQFLLEGVRAGERNLYINLSESEAELRTVAASHGWSLDGLHLFELKPSRERLDPAGDYTLLHPSEVELSQSMQTLLEEVERVKPSRVVIDSLSDLRLLAEHHLRYRRQVLMLKEYFAGKNCTVVLLDDRQTPKDDFHLQTVAHGVISLEKHVPLYGPAKRRLCVVKLRGVQYPDGYHDYRIVKGGIVAYPTLVASRYEDRGVRDLVSSNIPSLDALLGGGLDRGTSTLLIGPAGAGKSAVATQYMAAAASRGEKSAIFSFDESLATLYQRAESLGIPLRKHVDAGLVSAYTVDPAELTPGELAHVVQRAVTDGARIVVLDSLNGYLNAMPEEQFLVTQMHELLTYLGKRGVVTILVSAQHGLLGPAMAAPIDDSYLAETVLLLRYFEASGRVRKAISVVKKRSGAHESTIREFGMGPDGIELGPPLDQFHGILTGIPTYVGSRDPLIKGDRDRGH